MSLLRSRGGLLTAVAAFAFALAPLPSAADEKTGAAVSAAAASGSAVNTPTLVPREVFIGDEAVLSFPSATAMRLLAPGERVELGAASLPEPTDSVTVRSVSLSRGAGEGDPAVVSVAFTPWNTGTVALPPFSWNGATITPPAVTVASIVDRTGIIALEPPRPPLLVPGTTWLLYGISLAGITGIILLWALFRKLLASVSGDRSSRRAARRLKFIRSELSRLERRIKRVESAQWHAELSRSVRRYLSQIAGDSDRLFEALTPREAFDALAPSFKSPAVPSEALRWLEIFDRVRFSGIQEAECRRERVEALRSFVAETENALREVEPDGRI